MAALPLDILREIATYWNGRTLGLTCRGIPLCADSYASVTRHMVGYNSDITVSSLPNGVVHGKCVLRINATITTSDFEEMHFDRGIVLSTAAYNSRGVILMSSWRARGHMCIWRGKTRERNESADAIERNIYVDSWGESILLCENVALENIETATVAALDDTMLMPGWDAIRCLSVRYSVAAMVHEALAGRWG